MERSLIVFALMLGMNSATLKPMNMVHTPIPNQYIVVLKDNADVTVDSLVVSEITGVEIRHTYSHVIKGYSVRLTDPGALTSIKELSFVENVEQDAIVSYQETAMTWGLDRVDQRNDELDGQSNFNGDGQGVNVYMLDSGIYTDHRYFGGRASSVFDPVDSGDLWGVDCVGHGTHTAGTVGADYYGIARGANLYGVKVGGCTAGPSWTFILAGMEWVAANHIAPSVASMSVGGYRSDTINKAVRSLYESGVTVSVSAGNSDYDACSFSPASAPEAITVGATDRINRGDYRAWFSNYGSCVDIFAPGANVLSTVIGSPTASATKSGTSMSCPHVTGAVAIALGNNPSLTPEQVWEKLKADSTKGVLQDKGPLSLDRMLYITP